MFVNRTTTRRTTDSVSRRRFEREYIFVYLRLCVGDSIMCVRDSSYSYSFRYTLKLTKGDECEAAWIWKEIYTVIQFQLFVGAYCMCSCKSWISGLAGLDSTERNAPGVRVRLSFSGGGARENFFFPVLVSALHFLCKIYTYTFMTARIEQNICRQCCTT